MNRLFSTVILLAIFKTSLGQPTLSFADSIRIHYKIPELAYAVVSSDSTIELQVLGVQRMNSHKKATIHDRFRIGSNTKTVTSYITALLVKQGKLTWETKFFDLYPELRNQSNPAYYDLSLKELLTFRARLIKWSYGNDTPTKKEITGNRKQQRYKFVAWILQQNPVAEPQTFYWSNPGYVAVGLMLEKATGKTYETLVNELGRELGIRFDFGQPNLHNRNQPWGHDANLTPEPPALNYKLNWLSSAGNINVSLHDYAKFVQLQLQGLSGKSKIFTAEEFETMHYGFPEFAMGWRWYVDDQTQWKYSFHEGNPGTFLTKAFICKDTGKAFIVFTNVQSDEAETGLLILLDKLKQQYNRQ